MSKKKKIELNYANTIAEMPRYAAEVWNNVPHFIYSEVPDENGEFYIMYPGSFAAFMEDVDLDFCSRANCHVSDIKIDILWDEDYMPISRCLNIIKTKDLEAAKLAIYELHALMYNLNIWYLYIPWLKMIDSFEEYGHPINFVSGMYCSLDCGFFTKHGIENMMEAEMQNRQTANFATGGYAINA